VEFGAKIYIFWGGCEGTESDATKDPITSIKRSREAMNFLCDYVLDKKYDLKFALEAKPNEPRLPDFEEAPWNLYITIDLCVLHCPTSRRLALVFAFV
jgi:xylose isomerase